LWMPEHLGDDDLAVYLRAVRIFAMLAERSAESVGLTLAQMRLLFTVSDLGVASCSAVAARLHVNVSSVTRLIARPVMTPLVSRTVSPANASAVDLELTTQGSDTVRRVSACRERLLRAALAGTDVVAASTTALGLARIIDRIDVEVAT
jgi:DNA-binding MarR family transcriptional regulator